MFAACGYLMNTIFWVIPIVVLAVVKLIPFKPLQQLLSYAIDGCASGWVKVNSLNQCIFSRTTINVSSFPQLSTKQWYMIIANHQSWVDILILQRVLDGKVPFLKFFLKQQLLYVPIIGLAWWALDFPFMKRYSKALLAKKPHLKGKDIEATKKSCQKFQLKPVSVVNFVEGTRFTPAKNEQQGRQFESLLMPRAGGLSFALNAMSGRLDQLVDVTIAYPAGIPTFWEFITGKVKQVNVEVKVEEINNTLIGDYDDKEYRANFQQWLNEKWAQKQQLLNSIK